MRGRTLNDSYVILDEAQNTTREDLRMFLTRLGFGSKCETVRASLPKAFRDRLDEFKDWFGTLESYRHALAHRIPLYIPPHAVTSENKERYLRVDKDLTAAKFKFDKEAQKRLEAELDDLIYFRPFIFHSFHEKDPPLALHPQCLADFNTVEDLAKMMRAELDLPDTALMARDEQTPHLEV